MPVPFLDIRARPEALMTEWLEVLRPLPPKGSCAAWLLELARCLRTKRQDGEIENIDKGIL